MTTLPVYTALNIPTVTSYPSLKCVQWSADGQLCYISKNAAVILTPDHGINFDNGSVIKATPSKDDPALGWFKTMIQHDKATPTKWPEYSQAWGAVSLGSIDLSVTSMAISPIGVSSNGGCIFATLSSNMDINFWMAGKNYLKGEWLKVFDVTSYLLDHFAAKEEENLASILKAQTVLDASTEFWSVADAIHRWILANPRDESRLFDFPKYHRYRRGGGPEIIATLAVADNWITQIAFSCWNKIKPGHCEGYLAYGVSDGSVGLVKITQILQVNTGSLPFSMQYDIQVTLENGSCLIYGSESKSGITALRWVHVPGRSPILVSSHPGLINLWSASEDAAAAPYWTGSRALRLQTQRISADASALHPVTGISYLRRQDRLVVTLFDGSFHVIRSFSADPMWAARSMVDSGEEHLTSEVLSGVSRATFVRAEKGSVDKQDMVKVNGVVSYDGAACFLWVYESARPSDFSYKHDAKHSSTLIVARMWEDEDDDLLLQNLANLLNTVEASSGYSPLHLLRPYLIHLRDPAKLDALHAKFLEILVSQPSSVEDYSKTIDIPSREEGFADDDVRSQFRYAVSTNLFGWDDLLSLRMRLSLADFAWKLSSSEERQAASGVIAQSLLNFISHRMLRTIIRHLVAVVKSLTPKCIPFVSRTIVQSLLPGCPPELTEEGKQLSLLIQPLVDASSPSASAGPDGFGAELNESCPACCVDVPLQDITTAVCANGHTWARCSVTTFILSTPWVRTCIGCSRKAFLPPSANKDLPKIAQGWVVEDLLEAVQRCLFCNNGFVSIL